MFREPALEADKKSNRLAKEKTGSFDKSQDRTVKG